MDTSVGGAVDGVAIAAVESMNFDRAFIGGCAISPSGVCVRDHAESIFKKVVIKNARHRVIIATLRSGSASPPI